MALLRCSRSPTASSRSPTYQQPGSELQGSLNIPGRSTGSCRYTLPQPRATVTVNTLYTLNHVNINTIHTHCSHSTGGVSQSAIITHCGCVPVHYHHPLWVCPSLHTLSTTINSPLWACPNPHTIQGITVPLWVCYNPHTLSTTSIRPLWACANWHMLFTTIIGPLWVCPNPHTIHYHLWPPVGVS